MGQMPEVPEVATLAEYLDESGLTLATIQGDFPGWRVWYSTVSGCCHARRRENFAESVFSGRRFHVAASTPGRLAVLLLHQLAMDEEEAQQ